MSQHHDDDSTRVLPAIETDDDTGREPRRRGPWIGGGMVAVLVLLAGGAYVAGYQMAGDKTPKNASVEGIGIGGLTHEEAVAKLTKELGPKVDQPIVLQAGDKQARLVPSQAGMSVDFDATVREAGAGKSWSPGHIWNVLRGGGAIDPVSRVDEAGLQAAVKKAALTFAQQAKDATIAMQGIKVVTTPSTQGVALDEPAAVTAVRNAWRVQTTVAAPTTTSDPQLTTEEVEQVKQTYGDPAVSGPITVKAGQKTFPVDVKSIAAATTFPVKDGQVSGATDMDKLWKDVQADINELGLDKGKDAKFVFQGGKPVVQPSADGVGIEQAAFTKAVQPAITKTGNERTVTVAVTKKPATFTTEQANKLGVKEVTGEFTTTVPYAEYRNVNLGRVAQVLNGKLVKPGEVFSMNDTLGERTKANGYTDGYVIQGNRLVKETGGGVSQSATTVFNAIFFAGLEDVEHHPHGLYFPRYPAGREATLYYGELDLKFRNNTDHGVVLQVIMDKSTPDRAGSFTVKVWSTKGPYEVRSTELKKSNYYDAPPEKVSAENCEPQSPSPGFTVTWARQFLKDGKVVKSEPYRWTYQATPEVTCV